MNPSQRLLLPTAMVAAIGVPLIALFGGFDTAGPRSASGTWGTLESPAAVAGGADSAPTLAPIRDWGELLRFDVFPNWVLHRWPRVSTAPVSDGLQGLRVPLVTGVTAADVCGSLTYYFDANHRPQRIRIVGATGDASGLVAFLAAHYGFRAYSSPAAGLYLATSRGQPRGLLRLDHAATISVEAPHQRMQLVLELNNPDAALLLSAESMALAGEPR